MTSTASVAAEAKRGGAQRVVALLQRGLQVLLEHVEGGARGGTFLGGQRADAAQQPRQRPRPAEDPRAPRLERGLIRRGSQPLARVPLDLDDGGGG